MYSNRREKEDSFLRAPSSTVLKLSSFSFVNTLFRFASLSEQTRVLSKVNAGAAPPPPPPPPELPPLFPPTFPVPVVAVAVAIINEVRWFVLKQNNCPANTLSLLVMVLSTVQVVPSCDE